MLSEANKKLLYATAGLAVYLVFILGILQGYIQPILLPYLGGMGAQVLGIVVDFIALIPGVYIIKLYILKDRS